MAAGEVRAAWQRAANRCFVQEDAKRAPRLSRLLDAELCGYTEGDAAHPSVSFTPLPSNSNIAPDARWWLHLHPPLHTPLNTPPRKQSNVFSTGIEGEEEECGIPASPNRNNVTDAATIDTGTYQRRFSMDVLEFSGLKKKPLPEVCCPPLSEPLTEVCCPPWSEKHEKQVLASLVAHGSSVPIENCDLPVSCKRRHGSGKSRVRPPTTPQGGSFSYTDRTIQSDDACGLPDSDSRASQSVDEQNWLETKQDYPLHLSSKSSRNMRGWDGEECSKGWILEALCHSQARAREAEAEAKQEKVEKERVMGVLFRQASVLFAYKQWLHVLQLDILSHRLNSEKKSPSVVFFPEALPPAPADGSRKRSKRSHRNRGFGRRVVALVLGCSLVGAGLLLGWTVGWMLPSF